MLLAGGTIIDGKYRVERLLGAGGMGSVWVAEHTLLGRQVAIKVLDRAASAKEPNAVARFFREAQTAAKLRSDHIVDVLDVGRLDEGTPFLVMELLEGETLSARIRREGQLPASLAVDLIDQLLEALGAAHAAGVLHRDVKPDNCFLVQKGARTHLKLLDFGISKFLPRKADGEDSGDVAQAAGGDEHRMTKTGVVMGTPYYMAPEQARGRRELDHRCDIYAAGAILYEALSGRVPFDAENVNELLFKIALEAPAKLRTLQASVDEGLERVVEKAMQREPGDRYASADDFRQALGPYLPEATSGRSSGERPRVVVRSHPPSAVPSEAGETAPMSAAQPNKAIDASRPPSGAAAVMSRSGAVSAPAITERKSRWVPLAGVFGAAVLALAVWALARGRAATADATSSGTTSASSVAGPASPASNAPIARASTSAALSANIPIAPASTSAVPMPLASTPTSSSAAPAPPSASIAARLASKPAPHPSASTSAAPVASAPAAKPMPSTVKAGGRDIDTTL